MAQVYDNNTGALITAEDAKEQNQAISAFSGFIQQYGDAAIAMAQTMLARRTDMTPKQQQFMLSTYTGAPVEPINKHINEVMQILGGTVQYHPPYLAKSNREEKPGYFKLLLKTNIKRTSKLVVGDRVVNIERALVIETASTKIVEYFLTIMGVQGWFDFLEPITCFFTGTQDEGYSVAMLSEDEMATIQEILNGAE